MLLLQFPGTVIHELAHLFTAEILGVRTGKLRLEPESIREDDINAGSVMIAQTDPLRRYLIGLAPLFWGVSALAILAYFLSTSGDMGKWGYVGMAYLIFAVSNTMFPSPADTKGITPFLLTIVVFCAAGYVLGIRFQLSGVALETAMRITDTLTKSLGLVVGMNIVLLLLTSVINGLYARAFKITTI